MSQIKKCRTFETEEAYLETLKSVLEKDYGVILKGDELIKAGRNIDCLLLSILNLK